MRMLEPREVAALLVTSKRVNEVIAANKATWAHVLRQVSRRAKDSINTLQTKIELMKDDDKRFAFLKTTEGGATDEEVKRLIDEYICKRKRLGDSLVKIVQDCQSFIYTGETYQEGKKQILAGKDGTGGGLLSALKGMIGMGGDVAAAKDPAAAAALPKEEDPAVVLSGIISGEKSATLDSAVAILSNTGNKLAKVSQERVAKWVMTLHRSFVLLFRSTLNFYCEARDVEKLKDFLSSRFEQLKDRNRELRDECKKAQDQLNENVSV